MEINVKRLREALKLIEPAVPKKHTLPVVRFIRLGEGKAVATDLERAVTLNLPELDGAPVLLPIRLVLDFLSHAPGHETAHIETTGTTTTIRVGDMEAQYATLDAVDFPPIPAVKAEGEGVLNGDALLRALRAVAPYATTEDTRPVLTAICLCLNLVEAVEVAAADGFRLAWERVPGKLALEKPLLIPARGVSLLARLWKQCAAPENADIGDLASLFTAQRLIRLEWSFSQGVLQMNFGEVKFLTQMTLGGQGTFPNYPTLIPTGPATTVTVSVGDLERAVNQVKAMAKDGGKALRLVWEANWLQLSAKAEEVGQAKAQVRATCSEAGKTAINAHYLAEYLRGKEGFVTFSTPSPSSPILFTYQGRPHVVMMPMFVEWGDGAPVTTPPSPVAEADTWTPETGDIPETPEVEPEAETPKLKGRRKKKG